jgi:2-polyprenyl-3-methyl-5-hydroxy-6-metoxy-1,4-benzoquinol methylase
MGDQPRCWCGSADLDAFSPDYLVCRDCRTLVAASMPGREIARVEDDKQDFYGRRYWFEYQERELGNPDITVRARADLPERCVYWLRTVLRYRLPPGRALEVGCGHGAFVMLLARAGFEATGLELSPWVVDFARQTFDVPVLRGPLEEQFLGPGSVDVITMMDVLEHLPEPLVTLNAALTALGEHGILVIQTPAVPPDLSWESMVAANHPFLPLMRERGHLYLFGETSLRRLLGRLGVPHVVFEPAYFATYDMFVVASRRSLAANVPAAVAEALTATPNARLVRALLDLDDRRSGLQARYEEVERDRAARLAALHEQGARLMFAEGPSNALRAELENLKGHFAAAEADRAARLAIINEQAARLAVSEADRAARLAVINEQAARLAVSEADRAARLVVIQEQGARLSVLLAELENLKGHLATSEADHLAVIQEQGARLGALEHELAEIRRQLDEVGEDRAARIRVIYEQDDRLQAFAAERKRLSAELATLRFRSVRVMARQTVAWFRAGVRALTALRAGRGSAPPPAAASVTVGSATPAASVDPLGLPPAVPVTVHANFGDYVRAIDLFVQGRPDLAPVRAYNHAMIDALDAGAPLLGRTLLDVGASPHGFSLERALAKGAAEYLGVGLGVWEPVEVRHQQAVGRLVAAYGEALPVEPESVDLVVSLSTFEHFPDGAAVLREIHRVLRPGGRLFANFQPVWTSSAGHHLHHIESVARLIPPWAHLLWTPATMRRALESRWPASAPMSVDEAVAWIYESSEINRVDVVTLRRMFETGPFAIEWMTPLPEDESDDKPRLATYLATLLPYSAEELLTRGFSIMMRKRKA